MKKLKQKMWLVSREVFAGSAAAAVKKSGRIYSVVEAEEKAHPIEKKKSSGFNK